MPQFNRLGGDMDEANAECAAMDEEDADRKYEAHMTSMVEAVKNHAKANYERDGWDMVVECYEDSEIREAIAGCTTEAEAIARLGEIASVWDDRRKDAQAEAGYDHEQEVREMIAEATGTHTSHSHCTCRDADDCCDFCDYSVWMSDLRDSGPTCEDGGYRPHRFPPPWSDHICYNQSGNIHGTYKGCFLSQEESDADNIPF